jgi:hypothetical protein
MKYTSNILKLLTWIFIFTAVHFSACEQEDLDFYIDCDYCLEEIPVVDTIWVSLTINDENPRVPLEFYFGDYEDGEIDWIDTATEENFWLISDIGVEYSVKASYFVDGEPVVAIDGDKLQVVNGEGECYAPCYYTRGGTMDVRLK